MTQDIEIYRRPRSKKLEEIPFVDFKAEWDEIFARQTEKTKTAYDFISRFKYMTDFTPAERNENKDYFTALSRIFYISMKAPEFFEDAASPEEAVCEWLNAAYKAVLLKDHTQPGTTRCNVAKAILNVHAPGKGPAYIRQDGKIVFAGASAIGILPNKGGFSIYSKDENLYYPGEILREGFQRIFCAERWAGRMSAFLMGARLPIEDIEVWVIKTIQKLHEAGALDTTEKIRSFDFIGNVACFLHARMPLEDRVYSA